MKYFSIKSIKNAYEHISRNSKDKFWGILGVLYSVNDCVIPCKNIEINTYKLSTFLEQTFRLRNKKDYTDTKGVYSVVFANKWFNMVRESYLKESASIWSFFVWIYRNRGFEKEVSLQELEEIFISDFHITKEVFNFLFTNIKDHDVIEYADSPITDDSLCSLFGNSTYSETIKLDYSFAVANAGDLSRGPFFQPLYASLETLRCLIIFPFKASSFYDVFNNEISTLREEKSRQIIYYGAPGTGKSHSIKEMLRGVSKENIIRTTFHPDSDYSTFVGAYKPTMKERYRYEANQRVRYPEDDDLAKAKRNDNIVERVIEYDFVPQAFINAYTRAYQTDENVYLIIEEINRGNCAQIFGDLFQLLDRDEEGKSDYTIKADADLRTFLEKELGEDSEGIKDGELCLPSNLYIWATMNTSDQSLFPIDSAFKRRWDWQYIPIKYDNKEWTIEIGDCRYSWVDFQSKVNGKIYDATQSEDKKLGDYFVKAVNNVISKDMLLNKVLFYLWNDVCKDGEGDIFKMHTNEGDKDLTFSELYDNDGTSKLKMMMSYLGVDVISSDDEDDGDDGENSSGKDYTRYTINGEGSFPKKRLAAELVRKYIQLNPTMSPYEVVSNWNGLGKYVSHFVETQEEYNRRTDSPRVEAVDCQDSKVYVSTNGWGGPGIMDRLMSDVNAEPWNLHVEELTD